MNRRWLSVLSPLIFVGAWEILVQAKVLDPRFIPQPSQIIGTLVKLTQSGQIWTDLGVSTLRIVLGFVLGSAAGVGLGLLVGISATFSAILKPLITAINPIPKILLIPFVILIFRTGFSERGYVLALAVSIFPAILLDTAAAVARIDPRYFELARNYGASGWSVFWTVALPASLPSVMNTLKLNLAYCFTLIVGVELFGAQAGIGKYAWDAANLYAVNRLGAGIVAIALTGWVMLSLLDMITPMLVPYLARPAETRPDESPVQRFVRVWWRAARPFSFTAATIPVLLGTAIAAYQGHFSPLVFVLALVGSILFQAGTNLVNDYYDYIKGADKIQVLGIGGAIQRGELTPRQILIGGLVAFGVGSLIGLYFVSVSGPFVLLLGVFSLLAGFFYTAGPAALAYIGLGEITVFIFMGPVIVIGAYFVQVGAVPPEVILASLPVGFLVAAILHANNLRDLESDKQIGKRTLATLLGRRRANMEYYLLIGGTYLTVLLMAVFGMAPLYTLIALLTFPIAYALMKRVSIDTEPTALNPVLRKTAQLHARFGLLLVAGWVLALLLGLVR